MTGIIESPSFDPYYNLALEEHLLKQAEDGVILYLWQNAHTVVIGKNQNPWKECKTTLLEQEGGRLARRLSGGGAVYHDLGNLNFTFLMPQSQFDLQKQFSVLVDAVGCFGIDAVVSGRNDMTAGGGKFSGNAFYKNGKTAYHHGTLLVDVDKEKMSRYLSPSKAKLQTKGVDSVRSRVVNLKELAPDITVETLKTALKDSFFKIYGAGETLTVADAAEVAALTSRNRSWEWNYGQKLPFTCAWEARFPWGGIQIQLQVENGIVQQAKVYTDAMDWALAPKMEQALTGCRFVQKDLRRCADALEPAVAADFRELISQQEI